MVYAGSHATSFEQASKDLKEEAELEISEQRIMRATNIGQERVEQRDAAVEAWGRLPCHSDSKVRASKFPSGVRGTRRRQTPDSDRKATKNNGKPQSGRLLA